MPSKHEKKLKREAKKKLTVKKMLTAKKQGSKKSLEGGIKQAANIIRMLGAEIDGLRRRVKELEGGQAVTVVDNTMLGAVKDGVKLEVDGNTVTLSDHTPEPVGVGGDPELNTVTE